MTPSTSHHPRRRASGSATLSRLTAALDDLDAEVTARRRRETALLADYATATDAAELSVRETVAHFARYYPRPRQVDEVIALCGLQE